MVELHEPFSPTKHTTARVLGKQHLAGQGIEKVCFECHTRMAKDLTVILSSIRAQCSCGAVCRHCSAFGSKTTIVKHKHASEYPAPCGTTCSYKTQ